MEKNSGTANNILGVSPDELAGYTIVEISRMIEAVQFGLSETEPCLTEEEIHTAAKQIYADANPEK